MAFLRIKIIGTEDTHQKMLLYNIKEAINQVGVESRIVAITDWEDIINYNIIQTPALVIRNQVLSQGFVPNIEALKKVIKAFIPDEQELVKTLHLND